MMMGGVFPATEDRFGAVIRRRMPYIGSVGALDMVNFGPPETVPEKYRGRIFYEHNPQVTLMRTTPEECAAMGRWIGARLNEMEGPVRFFLPEGGVSALDAPGQPFDDPGARARALHRARGHGAARPRSASSSACRRTSTTPPSPPPSSPPSASFHGGQARPQTERPADDRPRAPSSRSSAP